MRAGPRAGARSQERSRTRSHAHDHALATRLPLTIPPLPKLFHPTEALLNYLTITHLTPSKEFSCPTLSPCFRHIVPSPQRIIKHIPMCKAGKQSLLLLYIYIIIKFYCHFILYWKHLNDTLWRCGVVAQGRINVSFLSPLHSSSSSIPYWPQIHFTATGGRSCVLGVTPHWLNCSLCCFIQRWKVL